MAAKITQVSDIKEITLERMNEELFDPTLDFNEKALITNIRERLDAIPIANNSMTSDELRQIVVDYLKLSVSFQWVCDRYLAFSDKPAQTFYKGKLYGGIPYINTASGNLYRWLLYYNEETGVMDTTHLAEIPRLFGTACSGTAGWALHRVVNSAEISWTHSMNVIHGFVPVGPYRYDYSKPICWTKNPDGKRTLHYSCKKICKANGEQIMFESYAMALPADCFSSNGHVRLAGEKPVVVRNEDGTIDGEKSTVTLIEQGLYTVDSYHKRKTEDGTDYLIRGCDGKAFTFLELFNAGYLVHTFREFLGLDPVEDGKAEFIQKEAEEGAEPEPLMLEANYPSSDVFTSLKNEKGEEVHRHVKHACPHFVYRMKATDCLPVEALKEAREQEGFTVEVKAQLSTGVLYTVYSGPLS